MDKYKTMISHFGFSAASIDDLGATEYTLVTVAVDVSGSVQNYKTEMENCLSDIVKACQNSPRAENLMLRILAFDSSLSEIHGFKLLQECNPNWYKGRLNIGGTTAMVDVAVNSLEAMELYAKELTNNDFDVNGILIVITDGHDNASGKSIATFKKQIKSSQYNENMESVVSILVGVGEGVHSYLSNVKSEMGMMEFIPLKDATAGTMSKLAHFVSQSISSQSKALGSGTHGSVGISKEITF